MNVLVTGGAGFIGSAVVRYLLSGTNSNVLVFDKLTYAGNLNSLKPVSDKKKFSFKKADICDRGAVEEALIEFQPDIIIHLAAETHVDRSIDRPSNFVETNLVGTFTLLDVSLNYWRQLPSGKAKNFRFLHVSTDEVFGSLGSVGFFNEDTSYAPTSPYSASKAGSDHLVRAWHHTYGLPAIVTNCSNNYGPYQFPEKLIPLMIINGLENKPLPIYGMGQNIRDWLYVEDHASALYLVAKEGNVGQSYNIGGNNELQNIDVVNAICDLLDEFCPREGGYANLITYVTDRPGHDLRYAIDSHKIKSELGWIPKVKFEEGLRLTVKWYLENREWWEAVRSGKYKGERLGLVTF